MVVNTVVMLPDNVAMAVRMATAMLARIRPYSMAVAPASSLKNRTAECFISGSFRRSRWKTLDCRRAFSPQRRLGRARQPGPSQRKTGLADGQLAGDVGEHGAQVGAHRAHSRDDRHGDTGSDKRIFDGRGTRLVLDEACNRSPHFDTPFGFRSHRRPRPHSCSPVKPDAKATSHELDTG